MKQICFLFFLLIPFVSEAAVYNVLDFGAGCDSAFDNRIAFHAAIDKAYENGGIVNGDFDKKFKPDYSNPRQAEFSVLYGENLVAGKIDLSDVKSSSSEIKPYIVKESSIISNK